MRRVSLTAAAVLFVFSCALRAGEECDKARAEAGEKVAKLVQSWQAALEAEKSGCPEERAKLNTEFAAIAKQCPFGSRMEATLGFARTVLDAALRAEAECAKSCTAAKAEVATTEAKPPCPAAETQAARGKLLKDLHQLVSFAVGSAPAAGGCEKACAGKEGAVATAAAPAAAKGSLCETKAGEILASVRKDACAESAAAILMKEIAGLSCAEKAQALAKAIRGEACETKAGEILAKAVTECSAAKEGAVATAAAPAAAKGSLCETKAGEILASVRKDACAGSAAAILMKEIAGLSCAEKAQALAKAIRGEACETKAGEILAKAVTECSAKKEGAVAATAGSEAGCCADILACAKTLKASWDKVGGEFASMCPQKKKELMASFHSLQQKSKVVGLMPETLVTIAQGMAALDGYNAKMAEYGKANPDALKSIPEEARKAFEAQSNLIREASDVLGRVSAAMKACGGEEKKSEATSAD